MSPRVFILFASLLPGACCVACSGDDIVVYREHRAVNAGDGDGGGGNDGNGGSAASGATANDGAGGLRPGGAPGTGGLGVPKPLPSQRPPLLPPPGAGGAFAIRGAGGAPPRAGSGGDAAGSGAVGGLGGVQGLGGSGAGGGIPGTCTTSADCTGGFICVHLDCVEPSGLCQPHPLVCDPSSLPVCGCDGVTYWNDCYRQLSGVGASSLGQCTVQAAACNTAVDCHATDASCARLSLGSVAGAGCSNAPGTCWVVPQDCSTSPSAPLWAPCVPDPTGQPPRTGCMNTCAAIRSGDSVVSAAPAMQCH